MRTILRYFCDVYNDVELSSPDVALQHMCNFLVHVLRTQRYHSAKAKKKSSRKQYL